MPTILVAVLGKIVQALKNPSSTSTGSVDQVAAALLNLQGTLSEILSGILQVFGQLYGAAITIDNIAQPLGDAIYKTEYNLQSVDGHIIDVILPHSLAYLEGLIKTQHIGAIKTDLSGIERELAALKKLEEDDAAWIKTTGKPKLATLLNWQAAFIKADIPAINTLRGWLSHPQSFTSWAAPLLAAPILGVLTSPDQAKLRDTLSLELVQSWADEPDRIWTAVQNWLVTTPS